MKEIIEELMENQEISTFEKGKYNDTVHEVYAALLSANVGVKNVINYSLLISTFKPLVFFESEKSACAFIMESTHSFKSHGNRLYTN
jgi:hypothetical protein